LNNLDCCLLILLFLLLFVIQLSKSLCYIFNKRIKLKRFIMENILINLWIIIIIVFFLKLVVWKNLVKNIVDTRIKQKYLADYKNSIFLRFFPKSIDLNRKGLIMKDIYNTFNSLIFILLFLNFIVIIFSKFIVVQ